MKENDWYGILGSLTLHAILLLIFMFMRAEPPASEQLGFIQVDFGTFSEGRPVQEAPRTEPEPEQPTPEPEPVIEEPPAPADPEVSKPVDLPDVEPVQVEEPPVQTPETEVEAIQPEEPEAQEEIEEEEEREPQPVRPLGSGNVEGRAGAEEGTPGEGSDEEKAAPFLIEGLNRTPVNTPLPVYAEKVNVTIRVAIVVNPQGEIVQRIPLMKGNPRLEQEVMQALQRWRFNPLPPNVPQENQRGTITFRFRLE